VGIQGQNLIARDDAKSAPHSMLSNASAYLMANAYFLDGVRSSDQNRRFLSFEASTHIKSVNHCASPGAVALFKLRQKYRLAILLFQ
jgi:hypothetical protein